MRGSLAAEDRHAVLRSGARAQLSRRAQVPAQVQRSAPVRRSESHRHCARTRRCRRRSSGRSGRLCRCAKPAAGDRQAGAGAAGPREHLCAGGSAGRAGHQRDLRARGCVDRCLGGVLPAARSHPRTARGAAPAGTPLCFSGGERMSAVAAAPALDAKIERLSAALRSIAREHAPAAFSSSLAVEDQVITDVILSESLPIEIFTLDTGRLHEATLEVLAHVRARYGCDIKVYRPEVQAIERYVTQFGGDAFYESVELRQRCCYIRKVEPLGRALAGKAAWVTGMRRAQSVTRRDLPEREYDEQQRLWKFNPLADWTEAEVWQYIRARSVPYNSL